MQQLNPSEISALIKQRIGDLDISATAKNEGTIVMVSDGIVRIHGLEDAMYGEMIEFDGGLYGMALNLEQDSVGAVVLGNYLGLQEGQKARCTGRVLEVPVGPELLGRVVDALGNPIDGKGPIDAKLTDKVEKVAPGVIWPEYELLKAQGNNAVDVVIESAFPLTAAQEQLLIEALKKRLNKTINATVEVNPDLIAGVVIRAGDQVIDDSALNKLEKMRTRLLA
ncbi:hypothetical protein GWI33_010975 [Rhynchophorus ferrugineus]|uniref:ATPase F1/V1/A1 complex alpha/beta subunit N-terminal domain-containing protein n=1 Tax=Rhynchophorus ferrugineus TaxID=354439 RepID=A0A834ICF0_RHYFE|nr:hypothetical protein GWI33_010975 [Rhynchophorus ferrugineus]